MDFNKLIKRIIDVSYVAKEGHIASSLSILHILYVLYGKILNKTDHHFILSKGHASLGLYTILEHFGLLEDDLNSLCKFNSKLGGHPSNKLKYVEASTGSLGHGLPMGVGMALGEKILDSGKKVFVIIGDGESNEGTIWESALLASNHKLNNLYCIMDYNHSNDRALKLGNVLDKFKAFNWECVEIDGHSEEDITKALSTITSEKPIFVLANTIKGKGIRLMENNPEWHHKSPNLEEYIKIVSSLLIDDVVKLKGKIPDIGQSDDEIMVLAGVADVTKNVIGNIAEVGVYSGGSAKLIKRFKNNDKKMYLFDTFSGLSDCNENDGEYLKNGFFIYDYELVKKEFEDDKDVTLYKGYFPDSTNIDIDNDNFSLVHLDVDTYTSTLNCLNYFYDKMTKGGIIVIHDYQMHSQIDGVPLAVDEFLSDKNEIIITLNTTQGLINKL